VQTESTPPAARTHRLLPLALLAALLGGCLKVEGELRIGKDGKGTWRQHSTVDARKAKAYVDMLRVQLEQFETSEDAMLHFDPFDMLDVAAWREDVASAKGVEIVRAKEAADPETHERSADLTVRFDSLQALFESGAVEDADASLRRTKAGAWQLTIRQAYLEPSDVPLDKAATARLQKVRNELIERLAQLCGEMTVTHEITLPSKVLKHNGTLVGEDERTVRWVIRLADIGNPAKLVQRVTFEDAGLKLTPFSMSAPFEAEAEGKDKGAKPGGSGK
jgi:hypothetical protein